MSIVNSDVDYDIWEELAASLEESMSATIAKFLLTLRFTERQKNRMLELAEKNNRGELTSADRVQLESFLRVGNSLDLLHAKARLTLKRLSDSPN